MYQELVMSQATKYRVGLGVRNSNRIFIFPTAMLNEVWPLFACWRAQINTCYGITCRMGVMTNWLFEFEFPLCIYNLRPSENFSIWFSYLHLDWLLSLNLGCVILAGFCHIPRVKVSRWTRQSLLMSELIYLRWKWSALKTQNYPYSYWCQGWVWVP